MFKFVVELKFYCYKCKLQLHPIKIGVLEATQLIGISPNK